MIPEWNHTLTDAPICPHCGQLMKHAWELDLTEDEKAEVDCVGCGKLFRVSHRVYVKYTTETVEDAQ